MIGAKLGTYSQGGIDPLVSDFISKHESDTGITMGAVQQAAIRGFVKRLRGIGTTNGTDFIGGVLAPLAIWPYCPSNDSIASSAGFALNLLDPNTYNLTFNNFVSGDFQPTGLTGGGTKYANTGIGVDTASYNNYMMSFYLRTAASIGSAMGALNNAGSRALDPGINSPTQYANFRRNTSQITPTITNTQGLFTESEAIRYRNVTQFDTTPSINALLNNNTIYLHCRNFSGAANIANAGEFAGFAYGTVNFTAAAMQDWYEAWDYYQTNVITGGRNV